MSRLSQHNPLIFVNLFLFYRSDLKSKLIQYFYTYFTSTALAIYLFRYIYRSFSYSFHLLPQNTNKMQTSISCAKICIRIILFGVSKVNIYFSASSLINQTWIEQNTICKGFVFTWIDIFIQNNNKDITLTKKY